MEVLHTLENADFNRSLAQTTQEKQETVLDEPENVTKESHKRTPSPSPRSRKETQVLHDAISDAPVVGTLKSEDVKTIIERLSAGFPKAQARTIAVETLKELRRTKDAAKTADIESDMGLVALLEDIGRLRDAQITEDDVKRIYLKKVVSLIKNDKDFSPESKSKASALFDVFEQRGWGKLVEISDEFGESDEIELVSGESGTPRKRRAANSVESAPKRRAHTSKPKSVHIERPRAGHPIWGDNGTMRGILLDRGGQMTSYKFDPAHHHEHRPASVFGHNGLKIGQWWPRRLCAIRDGAHGVYQGGIYGKPDVGAYSVVVAGTYTGLDVDGVNSLWYSGSQSLDNEDKNTPNESNDTLALRKSLETGKPVRVLRAATSHPIAPAVGLRYDGLYQVRKETLNTNLKGGKYLSFNLVRMSNQGPVDLSRPTAEEREQFDRVKEGY